MSATITKGQYTPATGRKSRNDHNRLMGPAERLAIWQSVAGMWKNRKNLTSELKKIRKEWDRKLPYAHS